MELAPFFKFGIPILLVITIGLLGRTRRIGFWGAFFLSIVLTPIGGFLVALISGPRPIVIDRPRSKAAPTDAPRSTAAPTETKKKGWFSRAA